MSDAEKARKELEEYKEKVEVWKEKVKKMNKEMEGKLQAMQRERDDLQEESERNLLAIESYKNMIREQETAMSEKEAKHGERMTSLQRDYEAQIEFYKDYVKKLDDIILERNATVDELQKGGGGGAETIDKELLARHTQSLERFDLERKEYNLTIDNLTKQIDR
eukprot:Sspe_Gene.66549::Locus_39309_Transcript_1_1_Confidence_1.000_Length_587::g.66549::m.66549